MVYLVRHGESVANLNKRFSGITDVELSENGREQARVAGQKLTGEKISHVYSSTLQRARDTAKIICDEIGFDKHSIIMEDCLVEVDFGVFENMTWDEIYANYREESEKWMEQQHRYIFPEGEGYDDIINRISVFIDNVPDNSLVVTHFGVIQAVMLYLKIADDENLWETVISNCDILVLNDAKFEKIIRNGISAAAETT